MIKKLCSILLLILCGFIVTLQAEDVKVTMKSGSTITGELKELVATDHVTLIIAGVESVIPMNEVASIEKVSASQTTTKEETSNLKYGQYQVTDTKVYPDSFTLKVGDQELTMVLVRGGWFNMGYDGRHSLSWDSEPIHRVTLSSYYVSKQHLNCHVAETLLKKKKISDSIKPFNCRYRNDAEEMIAEISMLADAPYRLMTEAEWEFVALMPFASSLFGNKKYVEWCSDYFSKYSAADQINPQGPSTGKDHVLRSYSSGNEKWRRFQSGKIDWAPYVYVRIAISADQIKR